jgi:hypothetical protein
MLPHYVQLTHPNQTQGGLFIEKQNQNTATTPCPVRSEPGNIFLSKRIGSTTYRVGVHFNPASKETLQDKILRLVKNDLNLTPPCVKMGSPQTGGMLEGDSLL